MSYFEKFTQDLTEISLKNSAFTPESYLELLKDLSKKSNLIDFIKSILSDDNVLQTISNKSYFHQNGFNKIVLHTNSEQNWRLRIHIWEGNLQSNEYELYDIHNHSFDFASIIVFGTLINEIYKISESGEKYYLHKFSFNDRESGANLDLIGEVKLSLESINTYKLNTSYYQNKQIIHRAIPDKNQPTITIVVQQINFRNNSDVFKKNVEIYSNKIGANNSLMSKEYVKTKLDFILTLLKDE